MRILTVPEDTATLRLKSSPVKAIDTRLRKFLTNLGNTLKHHRNPIGVGLSAIQVGRPIRAFATFLPPEAGSKKQKAESKLRPVLAFYINPEIVDHPQEMTLGEDLVKEINEPETETDDEHSDRPPGTKSPRPFLEGCLSIPRVYGSVLRWPWIKAKSVMVSEDDLIDKIGKNKLSFFNGGRHELRTVVIEGLTARVFQHEIDHLNGILFTDHVVAEGGQLYRDTGGGLEPVEV